MPLAMIFAAALQAAQPAPLPAEFVIHGDYGASPERGNLRRLLEQWTQEGAASLQPSRRPPADLTPCLSGPGNRSVDHACAGRLYPQRPGEPPTIAIVARGTGQAAPVYNVYCYGPDGAGIATGGVDMNRGGAFSSLPREQSEIRRRMRDCLQGARRGAVLASAAAMRGFDDWGGGHSDFSYHRFTGDCADLLHRIGRSATRGSYTMPLQAVRWSLDLRTGSNRRVHLSCLEGACVRSVLPGREAMAREHFIAFPDAAGAAGYLRRLDSLKRACAA